MPRRRELRAIAAGFLQQFVSRFNDVRGYWALGAFYKSAGDADATGSGLSLFTGESEPNKRIRRTFHAYILLIFGHEWEKGLTGIANG